AAVHPGLLRGVLLLRRWLAREDLAYARDAHRPDRLEPGALAPAPGRVLRGGAGGDPKSRGDHSILHDLPAGGLPLQTGGILPAAPLLARDRRRDLRNRPATRRPGRALDAA